MARYRYHFHIDTIDDLTATIRTSFCLESHLDIIRLITMTSNTTNKMKAVVYRGPNHVEVVDKDIPTPGPGEVVVRVTSSGLWYVRHGTISAQDIRLIITKQRKRSSQLPSRSFQFYFYGIHNGQ